MSTNRVAILVVSLAVLVSCAETRHWTGSDLPDATSSELRPVQFNDVPAPFGFDLQTSGNRSLTYQDGELRRGKLLYKGTDSAQKIAAFYRSQMIQPPYGWTALPETLEGSKNVLKFRKPNSRSTVSIYTQDIFTFVQIEVEPTNEA
ncbi:MAG: hypothetical protein HYR85_05610 [Planctomycetes bacterium]|nr:hypothetical protein [Planctomycetota bacterium]MBI3848277.1 hypothetical protein [Planctomycetota bacterium]